MLKDKIMGWIHAMRLRTLPLAFSTIITGSALSVEQSQNFYAILGMALLTTLLLQVLSNFSNDLGDTISGVDNEERQGPERAVQSGALSKKNMVIGIVITSVLTLIAGIVLLTLSFTALAHDFRFWIMLALGIAAMAAAVRYTLGSNPYGYHGLGDLFVFLFFGLLGVLGTYFLHTHHFDWLAVLPACSIGLFSAAVLNLNNLRDIKNDAASGKRTFVVILGLENAKSYHAALIILGWGGIFIYYLLAFNSAWDLLYFLPILIHVKNMKMVLGADENTEFDPELKKVALATFAFSILFFVAHLM